MDYDTFYLMLQYLYTGALILESLNDHENKQEQVARMYKAMHQYLLFGDNPELEKFCLSHYMESLTPETFVDRLHEDKIYDKLIAKLTEYAKNEKKALGSCSAFRNQATKISNTGPLIDIFLAMLE